MSKNSEKFILTISGELEELVYENAISLLPEYQKKIFFDTKPKYNTNKDTYRAITEMGERIIKKMELDKDYSLYSEFTCEYKNDYYIFDATLNIFEQCCNFSCRHMFFGGDIINNSYNSIIVTFNYNYHSSMPIDYKKHIIG